MRARFGTAAIAGGLAPAAFAVALLSGCGSSGPSTSGIETVGSSTTDTTALTKDAYIRQADGICAESAAAVSAITPGTSSAEQAAATTQELSIVRDELKSLQTLGAPEGDAPDSFLSAMGKVVDQLQRKQLALERNDQTALTSIASSLDAAESSAGSAARSYGLKKCGDFGTPSGTVPTPTGRNGGSSTSVTPTTTTVTPTTVTPTAPAPTPAPTPAPAPGGTGTPPTGGGGGGSGGSGGVGIG